VELKPGTKPIDFKPLSDGLGFHPFADGLPYAPVAKRAERPLPAALNPDGDRDRLGQGHGMGTGAQSAGRAVPVMPGQGPVAAPPRSPQPTPTARPARISVPVAQTVTAQVAGVPAPAVKTQPRSYVAPAPSEEIQARFGFGYLFKRTIAFLVDASINTTLCFTALGAVMVRLDLTWDAFSNANVLLLGILFLAMFNWSIMTAQEVLLGTTIGKRMFGLVLRGDTSALFLRSFFFLPSLVFCGLGIVWAVFDRRRRCWHDHVVNVQPLELAQL
jgi:hypothetical protein